MLQALIPSLFLHILLHYFTRHKCVRSPLSLVEDQVLAPRGRSLGRKVPRKPEGTGTERGSERGTEARTEGDKLIQKLMEEGNDKSEKGMFSPVNGLNPREDDTLYDIVINRANCLVTSLNTTGWEVWQNETALREWKDRKAIYAGVMGLFDVGKTHLLQKLSSRELPCGFGIQTKGLSGVYSRDSQDSLVYFDTAGARRAVEQPLLFARLMTDQLIEELVLELCDALVLVVEKLTIDMEKKIMDLEERIYDNYRDAVPKKQLYIVHNFQSLSTLEDVNRYVQWDIIEAYGAEQKTFGADEMKDHIYFYHMRGSDRIHHFVYAREGTEAGNAWNDNTLRLMKTFFNSLPADKLADPMKSVRQTLPDVLRDYLQPFPEPIDERNTAIVRSLGYPRRVTKHVPLDGGSNYVTVLGATAHTTQEVLDAYKMIVTNDELRLAQQRPLHFWANPGSAEQYTPPMTIYWSGMEWIVAMDCPGVRRTMVAEGSALKSGAGIAYMVRQHKRLLVVRGLRPRPPQMNVTENLTYTHSYCHRVGLSRFEPFLMAVALPPDVDTTRPTCRVEDGVIAFRFRKLTDDTDEEI